MTRGTWCVLLAIAAASAGCGEDAAPGGDTGDTDRPAVRPLASSVCAPMAYEGPGRPSALIAVSTTLHGGYTAHGVQASQAVKWVLAERGWRAGRHRVGVQICDEAGNDDGEPTPEKCRRTAEVVAGNSGVVALIGPLFSSCALHMLAPLNEAPGGGLATISPSNTYLGLTRSGPGVQPGEPGIHRPTGRATYARLSPADDVQGAAAAVLVKRRRLSRAAALHDGEPYGRGLATAFQLSAERLGLDLTMTRAWDPDAERHLALARALRARRTQAVFLGGLPTNGGLRLIKDLRRSLGRELLVIASDSFNDAGALVEALGADAEDVKVTAASLPNRVLPPAGRRWADEFERRFSQQPCCYAVQAGEAMRVVLDAIAASDGSRAQVRDRLMATRVRGGVLGDYAIDEHGDTTLNAMGIYELRDGQLALDTLITPPSELLARE